MVKLEGAKHDTGKLKLSAVPPEVIEAIATVRRYGYEKYGAAENWRSISPDRWHEALLRHVLAMWEDPFATDEESGLPVLWHVAANAAFLCACLEKEEENQQKTIEDLRKQGPRWISVEERLPEQEEDVLMLFGTGIITGGFVCCCGSWCAYSDGEFYTDCSNDPTHWMPLPEPPGVTP